jgi:hypothetical protein
VKLPRDNVSHIGFCNDDLSYIKVFACVRATYDAATFVDRMRIGHTQTVSMTRCVMKKKSFKRLGGADVNRRGTEPVRL